MQKSASETVKKPNFPNDLGVPTVSVEDTASFVVFSLLTCLLQPWSVCVEVVDPNAGGRHSPGHLV